MLRPVKMKKVRIFALKSSLPAVIKSLHEAGLMEIRKFRTEGLESGRPLGFFDEVSTQLVRLRNTLSNMDQELLKKTKPEKHDISGETAVNEAAKLNVDAGKRIGEIAAAITTTNEEITRLDSQLKTVERLEVFRGINFSKLTTKSVAYTVGDVPAAKLPPLKKKLEASKGKQTILSPERSTLALILYSVDAPVDTVLAESGFSPISIPDDMTTPEDEHSKIDTQLKEYGKKLAELEAERKELTQRYAAKTQNLVDILEIEAERSEISSKFADSARISVIQGWIQESDFPKLKKTVDSLGDDASIEEVEVSHHEQPPIVLENPGIRNPFEYLTKAYSLPNYFEIDPTITYFISLPIIYGMIVGDVIYGFISLAIASFFLSKFKSNYVLSNVAKIWLFSAVFAIIFGIMFDEWGGLSHFGWAEYFSSWGLPSLASPIYQGFFSRLHHFPLLLGVTILTGLIHLGFGFILGAYNLWGHHRKHAYAKIAWLGVEIGGTVAIASYLGFLPEFAMLPGIGFLVAAAIGLFFTEGIVGMLEIPGLAGNVLSYARIAAVGVVGVVLAEIINEIFLPGPAVGLLVLIMIPLLVILHSINTFIAMFEAIIQGGRLNVIEFRSKFLEGGGVLFNPFSLKK